MYSELSNSVVTDVTMALCVWWPDISSFRVLTLRIWDWMMFLKISGFCSACSTDQQFNAFKIFIINHCTGSLAFFQGTCRGIEHACIMTWKARVAPALRFQKIENVWQCCVLQMVFQMNCKNITSFFLFCHGYNQWEAMCSASKVCGCR